MDILATKQRTRVIEIEIFFLNPRDVTSPQFCKYCGIRGSIFDGRAYGAKSQMKAFRGPKVDTESLGANLRPSNTI